MSCSNIDPINLAVLSSAIAIAIARENSADDNNVIGNLLVAVGGIILEVAAQQAIVESKNGTNNNGK